MFLDNRVMSVDIIVTIDINMLILEYADMQHFKRITVHISSLTSRLLRYCASQRLIFHIRMRNYLGVFETLVFVRRFPQIFALFVRSEK